MRYKVHTCIANCPSLTLVKPGTEPVCCLSCKLSKKSKSGLCGDRAERCNRAVLHHKQSRAAYNLLHRLVEQASPQESECAGIYIYIKKKRIINTLFYPQFRDDFPVQHVCLTEVLYWAINRNQLKERQKPAQSTVSLTTPVGLWGHSRRALWTLHSASWSSSVVKVLRSPQLSRCSNLGCRLKGDLWALEDTACWPNVITFKREKKIK